MEETFLRSPRIIRNSISTAFSISLPLSRYIIGDYDALRSENEDGGNDVGLTVVEEGYSKPLLVLDVIWNSALVLVFLAVLLSTLEEKPSTPLRVWIGGYASQCLLHVGSVYYEYLRKIKQENHGVYRGFSSSQGCISIARKLEAVNTVASSFWWMLGFYWIVGCRLSLLQDSPNLYWLAVVYLALDVFMIFCIGFACLICLVLFCCIPVAAIAHAMTIKERASENVIRLLPRFRFHHSHSALRKSASDLKYCGSDHNTVDELILHPEDSECCICLTHYIEGAELSTLPCYHQFHYGCISKWLRINATCPLCKFNILKCDQSV